GGGAALGKPASRTAPGGQAMSQVRRRSVVDYGYGEMARRRERLLAAASPALRARLLGSPPAYDSVGTHWITVDIPKRERLIERDVDASPGVADVLRREVRSLERARDGLRAEIEALRRELQEALSAADGPGIADVARRFILEMQRSGYRINGH